VDSALEQFYCFGPYRTEDERDKLRITCIRVAPSILLISC